MSVNPLDRRDFARLSVAAVGGLFAGAQAIASDPPPGKPIASPRPEANKPRAATGKPERADARSTLQDKVPAAKPAAKEKFKEVHICRGLNTCEGKGRAGNNKCAGQGDCATTATSPHQCSSGNACRDQGGCGPTAGKNQCAGFGDGAVPLHEDEWPRLRKEFEARMKRLKQPIGAAPKSRFEEEHKRAKERADARAAAELEALKKAESAKGKQSKAASGEKPANGIGGRSKPSLAPARPTSN
jgi:hypothetical protein